MKETRISKRITLRDLGEKTGINLSRLCALEQRRAEPTSDEVDKLAMVIGTGIKFAGMEEAKERQKELQDHIDAMGKVYDEVKSRGLGKGHGGKGDMPCPKCGATLYFSVASFNGHVCGKCSTDGCLAWMQ